MIELIWTEIALITMSVFNCVYGIGAFAAKNVSMIGGWRGPQRIITGTTRKDWRQSAAIRVIRVLWTHTL